MIWLLLFNSVLLVLTLAFNVVMIAIVASITKGKYDEAPSCSIKGR